MCTHFAASRRIDRFRASLTGRLLGEGAQCTAVGIRDLAAREASFI